MNRRLTLMAVAVLLVSVAPAVSQTDDHDSAATTMGLDHRPGLDEGDWSRLEPIAIQDVPLSRFSEAPPSLPVQGLFGHDAGCDTADQGSGWAVTGTPTAPCEEESHGWGFRYAVHDCPSGCYSDGLNEEPGTFGMFIFSCSPGTRSILDFTTLEAANLGTGECRLAGWGQLPTAWGDWTAYGWVRDMRFSYSDNLQDALVHLVL